MFSTHQALYYYLTNKTIFYKKNENTISDIYIVRTNKCTFILITFIVILKL